MILTIDAGSRSNYGAVIMNAWKYGIEVEKLQDYQLELTTADEERMDNLMKHHPTVKVLHRELIKEVTDGTTI